MLTSALPPPPPQTIDDTDAPSLLSDSVKVHLDYDGDSPPPVPVDGNWTRFICLSDTHSQRFHVPWGDVLLHSGDLTNTGKVRDFDITMEWLRDLPHQTKIIIAGNHDLTLHEEWYKEEGMRFHHTGVESVEAVRELVKGKAAKEARIVYLEDEAYEFQAKEGGRLWSVYGCPWTPYFGGWAFNYRSEDASRHVGNMPKTDILLTHGPPLGIHDLTTRGARAGCPTTLARVSQTRPRLQCFGHIHEGRGATIKTWDARDSTGMNDEEKGPEVTAFVNAANQPLGRDKRSGDAPGRWRPPGSAGWQPIIVDLRDDA